MIDNRIVNVTAQIVDGGLSDAPTISRNIDVVATTDGAIDVVPGVSGNLQAEGTLTTSVDHNTVSDYNLLDNKPQINSGELVGNRMLPDIGVDTMTNMEIWHILQR